MKLSSALRQAGIWFALFAGLTLLVQARWLLPLDEAGMRLVAAYRPEALTGAMNWAFRLGFLQVDLALALLLSLCLLARRRPWPVVLAPLMIVVAVGVQAGLRLAVDAPPPRGGFELQRVTPAQPVGYILDRADAAARETLTAAATAVTAPSGAPSAERGSYPSGHACRILFLALALGWLGRAGETRRRDGETGRWGDGVTGRRGGGETPRKPPLRDGEGANVPEGTFAGGEVCPFPSPTAVGEGRGEGSSNPTNERPLTLTLSHREGELGVSHRERELGAQHPAPIIQNPKPSTQNPAPIIPLLLAAVVLLVGYSAIYFGYHWPSDLLGGYLLAAGVYKLAQGLVEIFMGFGVVRDAAGSTTLSR